MPRVSEGGGVSWARRFAIGLSTLRDRAANLCCRLAATRFNPSRERRAVAGFWLGYRMAIRHVDDALKLYGELNLETCGDNILMDPLLRGEEWNDLNVAVSRDCSIMSTIHSAQYHASEHMRETIGGLEKRFRKNEL
jgi:hypothetical protein